MITNYKLCVVEIIPHCRTNPKKETTVLKIGNRKITFDTNVIKKSKPLRRGGPKEG